MCLNFGLYFHFHGMRAKMDGFYKYRIAPTIIQVGSLQPVYDIY
jgi:hypothetical protein